MKTNDSTGKPVSRSKAAGNKAATRDDICRILNVSSATVSRALNNKPGVGPKLREKIVAKAKELNYVPLAAARNLSRAKSDTLGLVFQDLTSGWMLNIFRGVMNRVNGRYQVLNALSTREGDEFDLPNNMLASRQVDGLIWLDMRATPYMIRQINKQQRPFVLLQQEIDDKSINTICIKNKLGAYEATRHLLNLGYKDLALITGPESSPDSQDKLAGANMALAEAGIKIPPENILEGHHVASYAVNAFRQRFADSSQLPEAIFCFNDDMAIALLYWLREHNIRVPEDIALVGYDGISEAKYLGLTTIETPMYEMGVLAAQRLLEIIEDPSNENRAKQITLTGQLCIRETCGASKQTSG